VKPECVTELNWWDEIDLDGLRIVFTPAKHFSGRMPWAHSRTLWGGWILISESLRIYYSGDGGYGSHFLQIGERFGPFDLGLVEGSQYNFHWPESHMTPEESVQASIDAKAERMMLMHWGAFHLSNHTWAEPIIRAMNFAKERDVRLVAPKIGETIRIDMLPEENHEWWKF